jgi:hypothetical protein
MQRVRPRTRVLTAPAPNATPTWSYLEMCVPADGTWAVTWKNGDFGRSPIYGQLLDKPPPAPLR